MAHLKLRTIDTRDLRTNVRSRFLEWWRRVQVEVLECEEVKDPCDVRDHILSKGLVEWERLETCESLCRWHERLACEGSAWVRASDDFGANCGGREHRDSGEQRGQDHTASYGGVISRETLPFVHDCCEDTYMLPALVQSDIYSPSDWA